MAFDAHANLAVSAVATAPSPATSGTSLVVTAAQGARFPAVPFNAVICPAGTLPDPSNSEIVRVTARSTDTFSTIVRAQEGTSARTVVVGDRIFNAPTAKTFTDLETPWGLYEPDLSAVDVQNFTTPGDVTIATGTFVAEDTVADVFFDVDALYVGGMAGHTNFNLLYGLASVGALNKGQQGSLKSGVTQVSLGAISPTAGAAHTGLHKKRITGLTVGSTYAVEITAAVVGYMLQASMTEKPGAIAASKTNGLTGAATEGDCIVIGKGATKCAVFRRNILGLRPVFLDKLGEVALSANSFGAADITPDGKKAVCAVFGNNSVDIIDCQALTKTTVALAAGRGAPFGVAISPDGTKAYIGETTSNRIVTLNIAAGTWGTEYGPLGGTPINVRILPDATKVYAQCSTNNNVSRVRLSDGNVSNIAMGSAVQNICTTRKSSTKVYALLTNNTIKEITTSTEAVGSANTLAGVANGDGLVIQPDEHAIMVTNNGAGNTKRLYHYNLNSPGVADYLKYTDWDISEDTGAVCVLEDGSILVASPTASPGINDWFGGQFNLKTASAGFDGRVFHLAIERAHA